MGFLRASEPLAWEESLQHLRFVRKHGLAQFLAVLRRCGHIQGDPFKWGDEVEHAIFRLVGNSEESQRTVRVALRSPEVLEQLREQEAALGDAAPALERSTWMPEYGRWMLESTPGQPFQGLEGLGQLEAQMALRRKRLNAALRFDEVAPTVTSMPLFGTVDFCEPSQQPGGPATESLFIPDEAIFPHPRFPTLTKNIRTRRGGRVEIRRPRFEGPEVPANAPVPSSVAEADALDHVYADAMAFGMGNCCLQVTMQASDISESRHLYDQLAPLTPIFLALTAATPFLRGWICDDDTRWGQVAQAVDDRTPAERGSATAGSSGDAHLAGLGQRPLPKSRYDSIDCYIGEGPDVAKYNDVPLVTDEEYVHHLQQAGCDETLAKHVAHLFARDPLVLFNDRINLDDEHDIDHWENLQSTNWQTLRWKPPPPEKGVLGSQAEGHIGWRVEFRSMEVQVTDFENAAFASLIILLSRVILDMKLNLYIPMSKLEENMRTAQRREACSQERFWFRTNILPEDGSNPSGEQFALMTIEEIMMGSPSFPGLLPLCSAYINKTNCVDATTRATLERYFVLVQRRASGTLPTIATWMRRFVMEHAAYGHDGRVPPAAAHDLMALASEIGLGRPCEELLGDLNLPAAQVSAEVAALPFLYAKVPTSCAACMAKERKARGFHLRHVCSSVA